VYDEISEIQTRTLNSTQRSLALVYESEETGVATAEELMRQREQLQNTEKNLDDINQSLKISQKHINSMKSVFGGIKGYFTGKKEQPTQVNLNAAPEPTPSKLEKVIERSKSEGGLPSTTAHPGLKMRGLDTQGFFEEEEEDLDDKFMTAPSARQAPAQPGGRFKQVEDQLDRNLDDLSFGLTRLKGLASGLGQEIDEQNDVLDRLQVKVDKADMGVGRQNKQMNKILGKKEPAK
jgi:synaptosomal-associated protein 29